MAIEETSPRIPEVVEAVSVKDLPKHNTKNRGDKSKEAKELMKLLSPDQGLEMLDALLQSSVPPQKINDVIIELLHATDKKVTAKGEFYETTNWAAKIAGLEQALKLKRFTQTRDGNIGDQPITKITFNVIENVNVQKIEDLPSRAD